LQALSNKICVLDEADSKTHAAQAALRPTKEEESKSTRFCFCCSYVSFTVKPLASRCTKFHFKPLTVDIQQVPVRDICKKEEVNASDGAICAIVSVSGGDLRKVIT